MSWAFLTFLVSLLSLAYEWWKNRAKTGAPLNAREQRLWNRVLGLGDGIRQYASAAGCLAEPPPADGVLPPDAQHPLHAAMSANMTDVGWAPFDNLFNLAGGKLGARLRTLFPDFPGAPQDQDSFCAAELKRIMNS